MNALTTDGTLTAAQRRTLERLIGLGGPPGYDPALADRLRARIESGLARAGVEPGTEPVLWLGKHRLTDRQRCEGLFEAGLLGEGLPFAHSARTAAGALFHAAMEADVATERRLDPRSACDRAVANLVARDEAFALFWAGRDDFARSELVVEATRALVLFRESFPPLRRHWVPLSEWHLKVVLAGGAVVLSGTPDLVLGRTHRLVLDFKTGRARPDHPEDMRFYALLVTLRTHVPPYRVATFFLDSAEWQPEDVAEEVLHHAADRVVSAARAALELRGGRAPALSPGRYCGWCPRASGCPALATRVA